MKGHKRFAALLALVLCFGLLPALRARAATAAPGEGLALTAAEEAYRQAHPHLKVGYVQDRIPVSFTDENGELGGISRYVFDRIAELSGFTFEYEALPVGNVTYEYLLDGGFDLVTSVEYNEENLGARGILTSEPYLSSRKVVVAGQDYEFRSGEEYRVAISSGSQTIEKVLHKINPNFQTENYDSIEACFDAVGSGRADLMILNQYVVEYWISKPAYDRLKVIPVLGMDDKLCFSAVVTFDEREGPSNEEGRQLIAILNKAIARISEDEISTYTIQAVMENQYSFTLGDFLYRYRLTVAALGVAFLIIVALAVLLVRQRVRSLADRADAKAKGQFLSAMSHEIRTPLNGLIGLNYLMEQNLGDRGRLTDYLHRSTATARYLQALVNDILDMSLLTDHKVELSCRPVDLRLLAGTVQSIVQNGMAEKGLDLRVETELPWPCVGADEVRIQQVLLNLLDNARKFTPAGGHVTLRLEQSRQDDRIVTRATVTDDGQGMSEAFQKQIFDAFAQERETVSQGNQGTGLGLSISHSLAKLMGGDLTCTSRKEQGSTFVFTFPAAPASLPGTPAAQRPDAQGAKPRVLVAEDNELNSDIVLELLAGEGIEADLARDGRQAVECFARSAPGTYDVILMDLLMPKLDGFQAAMAIRALDRPDARAVRIIACTANSFAEDREKALACGMDDFIAKPVDLGELMQKLNA